MWCGVEGPHVLGPEIWSPLLGHARLSQHGGSKISVLTGMKKTTSQFIPFFVCCSRSGGLENCKLTLIFLNTFFLLCSESEMAGFMFCISFSRDFTVWKESDHGWCNMLETFRPATETLSPLGTRNTQQWLLALNRLWSKLCNPAFFPRCFLGYRRCSYLWITLKITKACIKYIADRKSLPLSVWIHLCLPCRTIAEESSCFH